MLTLELSLSETMNYLNTIVDDRTTLYVIDDNCLYFTFPFRLNVRRGFI